MEIICLNYRSTFHIICCRYGIRCSVFSVHCSTNKKSTSGFCVLAFPIKLLHFKQSNAFPIEFVLCTYNVHMVWVNCLQTKTWNSQEKMTEPKELENVCTLHTVVSFLYHFYSPSLFLSPSFYISLLFTFLLVPSVVDVHVKCRFAQTSFHKC